MAPTLDPYEKGNVVGPARGRYIRRLTKGIAQ
jgi:hypothetical protein